MPETTNTPDVVALGHGTRIRELGADGFLPRGTVLEPQCAWSGQAAEWAARVNDDPFPCALLGPSVAIVPLRAVMAPAGWAVVDVSHGPPRRSGGRPRHRYVAHRPDAPLSTRYAGGA